MLGHPVKMNVLDVLRNVKLVIKVTQLYLCYKRTNERTELLQFRKQLSYDGDLSPCQV